MVTQSAQEVNPEDKEAFIRAQVYSSEYDDFTPKVYDWPTYAYKTE